MILYGHRGARNEAPENTLPGFRYALGKGITAFEFDVHLTADDQLVVIHDELDLEPDVIRLKLGGGDNGHNGLKSLRASLGSGEFNRVRLGIGRPPGRQDPADFVLRDFPASARADVGVQVERAADAVELLLTQGLVAAQNAFN